MKLTIATPVNQTALEVWQGFDKDLFLKLSPPFPKVRLLQFDGSLKGDRVGLELNFGIFRQRWISDITENGETDEEIYFIDKGVKLPFFLKKWQHRHTIKKMPNGSVIIDDIFFSTGLFILDLIMYPGLYLQFYFRKPVYREIFK
jgi:ligand-binding SRPBCC domain-containing protein